LSAYCFLVKGNIPKRFGLEQPRIWQANIHGMLRRIPSITSKDLEKYFESIDSKLALIEKVRKCSSVAGASPLEIKNH
jgi:hypothetical protein